MPSAGRLPCESSGRPGLDVGGLLLAGQARRIEVVSRLDGRLVLQRTETPKTGLDRSYPNDPYWPNPGAASRTSGASVEIVLARAVSRRPVARSMRRPRDES